MRSAILTLGLSLLLMGCGGGSTPPPLGPDGRPLPKIYRIAESDASAVQFRMLDAVNSLRQAAGASPLQLNAALTAAAATHARDMAVQNRPWHFGSDGSSPIQRVQRAGYTQTMLSESISESYETELETLAAWTADPSIRASILDSRGRDLGFSWYQEPGGKLWWTMIIGGGGAGQVISPSPVAARTQG